MLLAPAASLRGRLQLPPPRRPHLALPLAEPRAPRDRRQPRAARLALPPVPRLPAPLPPVRQEARRPLAQLAQRRGLVLQARPPVRLQVQLQVRAEQQLQAAGRLAPAQGAARLLAAAVLPAAAVEDSAR
ncbi:EspF repeat-containing protein [Lacipirellula parvula]|uniref:EspF repeat-containing protein n=1 Tax=Lacipirellula parvula TaxID=2650471 RepID=UPI003B848119